MIHAGHLCGSPRKSGGRHLESSRHCETFAAMAASLSAVHRAKRASDEGQRRVHANRGDDEHDLRWLGQRRERNIGGSTPLDLAEARRSMRPAEPALPRGAAISIYELLTCRTLQYLRTHRDMPPTL